MGEIATFIIMKITLDSVTAINMPRVKTNIKEQNKKLMALRKSSLPTKYNDEFMPSGWIVSGL